MTPAVAPPVEADTICCPEPRGGRVKRGGITRLIINLPGLGVQGVAEESNDDYEERYTSLFKRACHREDLWLFPFGAVYRLMPSKCKCQDLFSIFRMIKGIKSGIYYVIIVLLLIHFRSEDMNSWPR